MTDKKKTKIDSECNFCTNWKNWILLDKDKKLWGRVCYCLLIMQFATTSEDLTKYNVEQPTEQDKENF